MVFGDMRLKLLENLTTRTSGYFKLYPVDREKEADYTITEHMFLFMEISVQGDGNEELCHIFPMTTFGVNIARLRGRLNLTSMGERF